MRTLRAAPERLHQRRWPRAAGRQHRPLRDLRRARIPGPAADAVDDLLRRKFPAGSN